MPFSGCLENGLSDVTDFNSRPYTESRSAQLIRNSLQPHQCGFLLVFQFWSVTLRHFRRRHRFNRLQHVQSQNLRILGPKLGGKSMNQVLGRIRIVDSHQDFHDFSFLTRNGSRNRTEGKRA